MTTQDVRDILSRAIHENHSAYTDSDEANSIATIALEALDTAGYTIVPKPSGDERERVAEAIGQVFVDKTKNGGHQTGHGNVFATTSGARARCMGPILCKECKAEAAELADAAIAAITPKPATDGMREALEAMLQRFELYAGEGLAHAGQTDIALIEQARTVLASDGWREALGWRPSYETLERAMNIMMAATPSLKGDEKVYEIDGPQVSFLLDELIRPGLRAYGHYDQPAAQPPEGA